MGVRPTCDVLSFGYHPFGYHHSGVAPIDKMGAPNTAKPDACMEYTVGNTCEAQSSWQGKEGYSGVACRFCKVLRSHLPHFDGSKVPSRDLPGYE